MASVFGTNQKIMMHGLRNSRAADLRKIILRLILRRLLRRDPNEDHSTNWWYLSASRKSCVPILYYLTQTQINTASKYANKKIRPIAGNMAYNRIHSMYPVYCIDPNGRNNYITKPISSDDNDCECYILCWELCLQNVHRIRFFHPFHISRCLHTHHGILVLFNSNNVHHDVFVLCELHFFHEWMPMVNTFYQEMVPFVES